MGTPVFYEELTLDAARELADRTLRLDQGVLQVPPGRSPEETHA